MPSVPSFNCNLPEITRQEALLLWLRRNEMTLTRLGRLMGGLSHTGVRQMLFRVDSITGARHQQLLDLGLPEGLLPPARAWSAPDSSEEAEAAGEDCRPGPLDGDDGGESSPGADLTEPGPPVVTV